MDVFPIDITIIRKVREFYNVTEETITRDVDILQQWIKQQRHLPQELPYPEFLEKILLGKKFNVEESKKCYENIFTYKTYYQDLFQCFFNDDFATPSKDILFTVALPKLGPSNERIFVLKATPDIPFNLSNTIKSSIAGSYLFYKCDYPVGCRLIYDFKYITLDILKSIPLNIFQKLVQLLVNCFPVKLLGIEVLNMKPFLQLLFGMVAKLSPKTRGKVRFHDDLKSLTDSIPLEYLPEEYGGGNGSIKTQFERMDLLCRKEDENLRKFASMVTDESLRVGDCLKFDEMYGVDAFFNPCFQSFFHFNLSRAWFAAYTDGLREDNIVMAYFLKCL